MFKLGILKMYKFKAEFTAKHGKITELSIDYNGQVEDENFLKSSLLNRELHRVVDWEDIFPRPAEASGGKEQLEALHSPGRGMNELFGAGNYKPSEYIRE
jgi:lipoate-protein ligase A